MASAEAFVAVQSVRLTRRLTAALGSYQNNPMLRELAGKAAGGELITREEALMVAGVSGLEVFELFSLANMLRERHRGRRADLCSIISAKTGGCPEDCSYCAQSASSKARLKPSPLIGLRAVREGAGAAKRLGAGRFCIVTSGRRPTRKEFSHLADMVSAVRDLGLKPCATLGLIGPEELGALKRAGLHRYHHNLETSERFFPEMCSTHTYHDKLKTIGAVKAAGLSLCSGGIFGLGEAWEDRVDMALALRDLGADSVPINFLVPMEGTRLGGLEPLPPLEALRIVSLYRFLLPEKEIRVCGGRLQVLGEFNSFVFMAGADGLLSGDCLTTAGRDPGADIRLIREYGMSL
jgi:biotin synthase